MSLTDKNKNYPRRYVKVEFFGYAPIDLAIQMHLVGKKCDVNMIDGDMKPYTEYAGNYDKIQFNKKR